MKHCVNCQFHQRMPGQDPMGRQLMVDACTHPECSDPVVGAPLICGEARANEVFCGLKTAKYFQKKETDLPEKGKIIEIG